MRFVLVDRLFDFAGDRLSDFAGDRLLANCERGSMNGGVLIIAGFVTSLPF